MPKSKGQRHRFGIVTAVLAVLVVALVVGGAAAGLARTLRFPYPLAS